MILTGRVAVLELEKLVPSISNHKISPDAQHLEHRWYLFFERYQVVIPLGVEPSLRE